jgi:catechol 2,3-dioxygenase-like lactoylglutathione lyase family enzyme
MIDHVSLRVSDYAQGKEFYTKALAPLGYELLKDFPDYKAGGFGANGAAQLWVTSDDNAVSSMHVGLIAKDPEAVKAFYDAAIAAGGKDNGAPGPRPDYGDNYYAAFVLDPDGNNVEAVFREVL